VKGGAGDAREEGALDMGEAAFFGLWEALEPVKDVVRARGMMNLSAIESGEGGERGRDVRIGNEPGDEASAAEESRCWLAFVRAASVGTNLSPSSKERNRDERRDSRSSR
jgi:hypothetical protein